MKKHQFLFILFIGLLSWKYSFSQDNILLMNGNVINTKVTTVTEEIINYQYKKKEKSIDKYRVFSITYANGKEDVFYTQDTLTGRYYTEEEMRIFIYGEQDAINGYKAPFATVMGVLICGTGGYMLAESFLVFAIPIVYTPIASILPINIKQKSVRNTKYLDALSYIKGYERVAKNKKIMNTLKGSVIGLGLGIVAFRIFSPSYSNE